MEPSSTTLPDPDTGRARRRRRRPVAPPPPQAPVEAVAPPWAATRRAAVRALVHAAYGTGALGTLGALSYAVLRAEARLARQVIGEPTERPPQASGSWGRARSGTTPLRLAVLGDSSAAGLGCRRPEQTPGALLAGALARDLDRRVLLEVTALVGARSAGLDAQVAKVLARPVDLAVVLIGANDVTHRVPLSSATRDLARAVRTLRAAGAAVVVGTCPDLGTVKPLWQPLRTFAAVMSRRLASAQTVAVVEAGGTSVSLGDLLGSEFGASPQLWSPDRFHPSPAGYGRVVDVLLPAALQALGVEVPGRTEGRESVQDVVLAASVAARDPGLVVETLEGAQGAAAVGPGRLARLRRWVPLVGGPAPEGRTQAGDEAGDRTDLPEPALPPAPAGGS